MGYLKHFAKCVLALLVSLDQVAQTILVVPFALLGLAKVPDPDETISGLLGRHTDRWWAKVPIILINNLFYILTFGLEKDHCAKVAKREARMCLM